MATLDGNLAEGSGVMKGGFVNRRGGLGFQEKDSLDELEKSFKSDTFLITLHYANNEIGTIQLVAEIGKIAQKHKIIFHIDACQSFTKTDLGVIKHNLDLVTLNAHKIHGPKGVGALYIRNGVRVDPLLHGGGQEHGFRSGTYNTEGIVGFGKAVEIANEGDIKQMAKLRDYFIQKVQASVTGVTLNGPRDNRLCNNINLRFKRINFNQNRKPYFK